MPISPSATYTKDSSSTSQPIPPKKVVLTPGKLELLQLFSTYPISPGGKEECPTPKNLNKDTVTVLTALGSIKKRKQAAIPHVDIETTRKKLDLNSPSPPKKKQKTTDQTISKAPRKKTKAAPSKCSQSCSSSAILPQTKKGYGLDLSAARGRLTYQQLQQEIDKHPTIKALHLDGQPVNHDLIKKIVTTNPKLKILTLRGCFLLADSAIKTIATAYPRLQTLDLSGCTRITNETVSLLAQQCRRLQVLKLRGCRKITDKSVMKLANHCQNLEAVYLPESHRITKASTALFQKNCPNIQTLMQGKHKIIFPSSLQISSPPKPPKPKRSLLNKISTTVQGKFSQKTKRK